MKTFSINIWTEAHSTIFIKARNKKEALRIAKEEPFGNNMVEETLNILGEVLMVEENSLKQINPPTE